MNKNITTPDKLNTYLATKQAKAWGFKSIADAKRNGYNTLRTSISIKEIAYELKITRDEAERLARDWYCNDLCSYSCVADLHCIYFKIDYSKK